MDARICSNSWMLVFVVIRGNKVVVGSGLNHTPHACVELWPK